MYRERAAGMYNELPFALAQCVIELPYNLVQAILFSCIGEPLLSDAPLLPPLRTYGFRICHEISIFRLLVVLLSSISSIVEQ